MEAALRAGVQVAEVAKVLPRRDRPGLELIQPRDAGWLDREAHAFEGAVRRHPAL